MSDKPLVSVVSPVYNEQDGIAEFHSRLVPVMEAIVPVVDFEVVYVDDGSADRSLEVLREIAATDPRVRVCVLSRNFGHQLAITAGIDRAAGDAVVVIDSDLQDPPETIADMVAQWRQGSKVVYGVRAEREGENRGKLLTAKAFYRVLNTLSEVPLPLDAGDFRLMDRQVVDVLCDLREENRYIRGLVTWVGFPQSAVVYRRDPRFSGSSKYNLTRMVKLALDGITSFSERPLRFSFQVGSFVTLCTALYTAYIVISKIVAPERQLPGYASLMAVVLFLGGVQLLTIGLLGEYVGRIYRESKDRPLYVLAEEVGEWHER